MTDPTAVVWDRPADKLRERAERRIQELRDNVSINDEARRSLMAQTYMWLRNEMATLERTEGEQRQARRDQVSRRLYGIEDLVANAPGERATVMISYRDAQDRVAKAETPADLQRLLDTATTTGDEVLARAAGSFALQQLSAHPLIGEGYRGVAQSYVDTRPDKAAAYNELNPPGGPSLAEMFEYGISAPSEIGNFPESEIQRLAANADQYRA